MKIALAILSIALAAQLSNAATMHRSKRVAAAEMDAYQLMKQLVAEIRPIAEAVLKDIPSSDAYNEHRQDWVDFLKLYDDTDKLCIAKLTDIIEMFTELTDTYVEDMSVEAEELANLLVKHGLLDFIKKYDDDIENAKDPESILDILEKC